MFGDYLLLSDINGLQNWDISNGENLSCMFINCKSLSNINMLQNLDVSNVWGFSEMYHYCSHLYQI